MLYLHFCIYFDCKDTNKIGNKEVLCKKNRIATKKSQNIWNFQLYVVSLHRQNVSFGYPGKFPERASRIRHYPFKKSCLLSSFLFQVSLYEHLIIIFSLYKPSRYRQKLISFHYQHFAPILIRLHAEELSKKNRHVT